MILAVQELGLEMLPFNVWGLMRTCVDIYDCNWNLLIQAAFLQPAIAMGTM